MTLGPYAYSDPGANFDMNRVLLCLLFVNTFYYWINCTECKESQTIYIATVFRHRNSIQDPQFSLEMVGA